MGNVMVIPARRQVGNTVKQSAQKKLRVAAYCRVSTDSEEQETSYEAQVTHCTEYLQNNPEWEQASIFADDGISGTNTKKRDEFNRMIDECMGDTLLQKTYTTDFLTKKQIKNNSTVPQYYVEGDHEAIIPKELFMQVQAELVRRRVVHVSPTGKKHNFS